ncbi:MAG: arginine--tRNA ligase [Bacteroidales bacterium]|nr:arginine--tRNA ligase [Bacteroidales bacterium]
MIEKTTRECCVEAVRVLYGQEISVETIGFEKTKREIEGDFSVVVFPLAQYARKSPEAIAMELGGYLADKLPVIREFHVIKGFLNLVMTEKFWLDFLEKEASSEDFGRSPRRDASPVVLEYSSPNTNKPLHLGHIRNNLLGHSLSLILEANGYDVRKVNLVNDRGIHICKSLFAYMKWGQGETPKTSGIKGDHLVGKYYVLFEKHYKEEIRELMASGMTEEEAAQGADLIREAQEILRQWETSDPDIIRLWRTMNSWTYEGFTRSYERLGVEFDRIYYESDTYLQGKELVYEGLERGVLKKKADGSIWVDLQDEGLDEKLLLRADGTSVYITQDLGTAEQRYEEYHPSKMIYVVGNEQIYHFDVLKKVMKKLGKPAADTIYHLSYGMVELPEGRMKSREGTVVDADDMMDEMYRTAEETTRELGKVDDFPEEEAGILFHTIGMGALKYFILKVDPKKNMLFDPKESIDFNGNTGPFIQYTHARIKSLLRKAADAGYVMRDTGSTIRDSSSLLPRPSSLVPHNSFLLPPEREILKLLYQYPSVVSQAGAELSPALIANYIYDLAREYNQFYQEIPVLREERKELIGLRLMLSAITGKVIRKGMELLGISVPDRM